MAKKTTKLEVKFRVDSCYKLLSEAQSRTQIIQYCSDEWGVCSRQAEVYIARAREQLLKDAEMTRPAWLAEALARLRIYEQSAFKRGQNQVAINALLAGARLIGLDV